MDILEQFKVWMRNNTVLSDSSIYKYSLAVNTISNDMLELGVIPKSLLEMSLFEINIANKNILSDSAFNQKNKTGNNMYSNSLKQFRFFILASRDDHDDEDVEEIEKINASSIPQTEKETIIKARNGQGKYRQNILEKYNRTCIVTGINNTKILVASHIKPWSTSNNFERIDTENGLLLSANLDKLFDCGLITFNRNGKMSVSSFVGSENAKRLHIPPSYNVDLRASKKLLSYIEYHRDILFVK